MGSPAGENPVKNWAQIWNCDERYILKSGVVKILHFLNREDSRLGNKFVFAPRKLEQKNAENTRLQSAGQAASVEGEVEDHLFALDEECKTRDVSQMMPDLVRTSSTSCF